VVLLEAMAAETAVVASDLTGYRNVARPGREALMVEPGSVAALRDGLRRLLDDPGERARLTAAGTTRAAEFSMGSLATAFVDRYEHAASRRRESVAARRG
jgi:phosphatidylinositol alpha-mannosyltransferase